tara:strand:- start:195 stop:413 length:219 start_codon:yes stop_codon:yes gene_type:complete
MKIGDLIDIFVDGKWEDHIGVITYADIGFDEKSHTDEIIEVLVDGEIMKFEPWQLRSMKRARKNWKWANENR